MGCDDAEEIGRVNDGPGQARLPSGAPTVVCESLELRSWTPTKPNFLNWQGVKPLKHKTRLEARRVRVFFCLHSEVKRAKPRTAGYTVATQSPETTKPNLVGWAKCLNYLGWLMGLEPTTTGITILDSTN